MATESTTTNFSFIIPVARKTYKTEIDANWTSIDSLLKNMTQITTHIVNSASPALDVSNSGTGDGIKVDKLKVTTTFDSAAITNASDIEIRPDAASATNGLTISVNGVDNFLELSTNQSQGFNLISAVTMSGVTILLSDLTVDQKIKSTTKDIEIRPGSGRQLKIFPDAAQGHNIDIKTLSATQIEISTSSSNELHLKATLDIFLEGNNGIKMFPSITSDSGMTLSVIKNVNEIQLKGSAADSVAIESEDTIQLRADNNTISFFPDFDGNPTTECKITGTTSIAINSSGALLLESLSGNLDIRATAGISLLPKFGTDPTLKLGIQNASGDVEVFTTATNNLIITSDNDMTLKADTKISLFPDFDGNPTQELKITFDSPGGGVELESISSNLLLGAAVSGTISLAIAGALVFGVFDNKVSVFKPLVLKNFTDGNRPAANSLPSGATIFNTDDKFINVSDGTNWFDPTGTIT